jgi:hypothetical protein
VVPHCGTESLVAAQFAVVPRPFTLQDHAAELPAESIGTAVESTPCEHKLEPNVLSFQANARLSDPHAGRLSIVAEQFATVSPNPRLPHDQAYEPPGTGGQTAGLGSDERLSEQYGVGNEPTLFAKEVDAGPH